MDVQRESGQEVEIEPDAQGIKTMMVQDFNGKYEDLTEELPDSLTQGGAVSDWQSEHEMPENDDRMLDGAEIGDLFGNAPTREAPDEFGVDTPDRPSIS